MEQVDSQARCEAALAILQSTLRPHAQRWGRADISFCRHLTRLPSHQPNRNRPNGNETQVREDPRKGVYIDAHEETVGDFETVLKILKMGERQRHVGCTEMNSRSSRSHTIFRLVVESQQMYDEKVHASQEEVDPSTLVATLNLVDLAGSESVRHTGATGIRQKEGGMINQSLLTLSRVIQTLTQPGNSHVNYRDSKLTRILQPSLSGNARMAIICCATAAEGFLEETRSTFQFASRAKEIKTRAVVNEIVDDKTQIRRMSAELAALKRQHAEQQQQAAAAGQGNGDNGNVELVESLRQEKAEQAEKIDRLKKLLLNIAPAAVVHEEEGEPLLNFHVDVSPRVRRGKRSRETWCPGGSAGVVTAPRPLRLLNSNLGVLAGIDEGESEHLPKRRSSEAAESTAPAAAAASSAGRPSEGGSGAAAAEARSGAVAGVPSSGDVDVEAIASKLEEALAAKEETDEEMKEFVAYTVSAIRVCVSVCVSCCRRSVRLMSCHVMSLLACFYEAVSLASLYVLLWIFIFKLPYRTCRDGLGACSLCRCRGRARALVAQGTCPKPRPHEPVSRSIENLVIIATYEESCVRVRPFDPICDGSAQIYSSA